MNKKELVDKRISIGFEFQRYLFAHPEIAEKVPEEANVFFILEDDDEFTRAEMQLAQKVKNEGGFTIFIRVEKLLPPFETRLVNPQIEATASF